jgi:hypothetical protein
MQTERRKVDRGSDIFGEGETETLKALGKVLGYAVNGGKNFSRALLHSIGILTLALGG